MINTGVVLGQFIASKAVVDKIKIPAKYYEKIDSSLRDLESWTALFKDVDTKKPHTWVNTGLKIMRRISEPGEELDENINSQHIFDALWRRGYERLDNLNVIKIYSDIIRRHDEDHSVAVIEGDRGLLKKISLASFGIDEDLFYYVPGGRESMIMGETMPFVPFSGDDDFPEIQERRAKYDEVIASLFWENKTIVKVDVKNDILTLDPARGPEKEYEGLLTELYDKLPKYKEGGVRRSLLLQGDPGTGKSTLVYNIAKRLSKRTLVLTHDFISWVNDTQWLYLLSVLRPEMIIVDDVDRIASYMARKLSFFEDHYCDVPLIIMTSNHYDLLPDAFKRPGRLDEIIEMQSPGQKIRYEVIRSLSAQEDVDVPESFMPVLDKIHSQYPGAYIVEMLRRVKALGWSYEIPEWDLTFLGLSRAIKEEWNDLAKTHKALQEK